MDVIHFPDDSRPARWKLPVLALGNFDGVHRGHRKVLDRLTRVAGEHGVTSVVMTFDPHPLFVSFVRAALDQARLV